ncbi:serine/threonine protein kinase [Stieleria sp. JC731]|uniref:serine/threonine protein kinase n=1 Tax=Pirellulaceae TaxID=2691357 RepID=UPI001E46FB71|nr:serine/threonine-protein kinase [Stieleria sp. JC731]MCC9603651.1 serine/threonine protein kinase [Stieleria sp. JC731]
MNAFDETDAEDPLVAAVKSFTAAMEAGQQVSIDSFVGRHPEIADELRPALEGLLLLQGAGATVSPQPESNDQEFIGKPVGDFQIVSELGRGGMGIVYEATQLSLGRRVALKVLPFASGLDEVRLQRFRNEAHAAAALHHTNIVPVYAVGSDRGVHYYAMQLIDGETLAEVIRMLRLDRTSKTDSTDDSRPTRSTTQTAFSTGHHRRSHYRRVVKMVVEAAIAIEHAHTYGVIHRDIKPGNLIRDHVGKIWVTDFGLAQVESDASHLTRTGDPMGTLRYMSPEQASGNRMSLDHRTDIYSLGTTLYELLVLQPAFQSENYRTLLNAVVEKEPPALSTIDDHIPEELSTIVRKAMAKLPAERYQTATAFAEDLQLWLDDKPINAKPPTIIERANKWRRRNSGLVTAAGIVWLVSTIVLAGTTGFIWRQQRITKMALDAQTSERLRAEANFAQARAVVDTFSELSEQELAYRPDTQDLRRQFLETSLGFYQELLAQSSSDTDLSKKIELTAAKVERLVDELTVLENIQPMLMLADPHVDHALGLSDESTDRLVAAVDEFRLQREQLANQHVGGLLSDNPAISSMLRDFDQQVRSYLDESQLRRLRQIHRQRWLPFTFKTREVVQTLGITREQVVQINRIIEETRPSRTRGSRNPFRPELPFMPPGGGGEPPEPPNRNRRNPDRGSQESSGGPSLRPSQGPPAGTEITVREIKKILTDEQRKIWNELVGEPFDFGRTPTPAIPRS